MKNYYDILEAQEATSYDSSISNISEDEAANHIDLFDANMDYSSQLVYANLGEQQLNYECLNFQLEMDGEENNDVSKNFNQLPNECLDYEEQDHAKNSGFDDLPSDSFDLDSIQKTPTSPSVSNMDFEVELSGEESLNMSIDSEEALDHSPHHFNNSSEAKSDREEKFNEILGCFGFKNNFKFEKESSTKKSTSFDKEQICFYPEQEKNVKKSQSSKKRSRKSSELSTKGCSLNSDSDREINLIETYYDRSSDSFNIGTPSSSRKLSDSEISFEDPTKKCKKCCKEGITQVNHCGLCDRYFCRHGLGGHMMKVHQSSTSKKYLRSKEVRVARKEKRTLRKKAIVVFEARFGKNYTSKFQSKLKIIMAEFSNN